jgi:hypothetical protein
MFQEAHYYPDRSKEKHHIGIEAYKRTHPFIPGFPPSGTFLKNIIFHVRKISAFYKAVPGGKVIKNR